MKWMQTNRMLENQPGGFLLFQYTFTSPWASPFLNFMVCMWHVLGLSPILLSGCHELRSNISLLNPCSSSRISSPNVPPWKKWPLEGRELPFSTGNAATAFVSAALGLFGTAENERRSAALEPPTNAEKARSVARVSFSSTFAGSLDSRRLQRISPSSSLRFEALADNSSLYSA